MVIKVAQVSTTQVSGGAAPVYAVSKSVHAEDSTFTIDSQLDLDTSSLTEEEALVVSNFIDLINEKLLGL